jgi:hypothetical protein
MLEIRSSIFLVKATANANIEAIGFMNISS